MKILIFHRSHEHDIKFGKIKSDIDNTLSKDTPSYSYNIALKNLGYEVKNLIFPRFYKISYSKNLVGRALIKIQREYINFFRRLEFIRKFKKLISNFNPEIIFMASHFRGIKPSYLKKLKKKYGFKVVIMNGLALKHGTSWDKDFSKIVDMNALINDSQVKEFKKAGANNPIKIPITGCANEIHKDQNYVDKTKYLYDVGFVGSLDNHWYKNRTEILKNLTNFNLGIWSINNTFVKNDSKLSKFYQGSVSRSQAPSIYRKCKIIINIHGQHVYNDLPGGGNLSLFEIPASGGFQIVDMYSRDWFEEGKEIVSFSDIEDLKKKIQYYLNNPTERKNIAEAGRKRALNEHTFEKRFEKIFKHLDL